MNTKWNKLLSLLIIFTMLFTTVGFGSFGPITVNAEETVGNSVYGKSESESSDKYLLEEKEEVVSEAVYSCQTKLIEFMPAPGQYAYSGGYGSIKKAKEILKNIETDSYSTKMVSLGALGGYVVYGFDHTIKNDQKNPYGVDFNVLGNAFFGYGEPGAIAVMKDENGNGKADDTWYDIAGSAYYDKDTIKDYEITYYNDTQVKWEDNQGASGKAPDKIHYPKGEDFSFIPQEKYTVKCIKINDKNPAYGYADVKGIKGGLSDYTKNPDNPYTPEVEGYGGGSIDIDWAVDEDGKHINLDGIDFVKISTAYRELNGTFGELSTEVRGIVDIAPENSSGVKSVKVKDVEVIVGEKLPTEVILIQSNGAEVKKSAQWGSKASTKEKGIYIEQVTVDKQTYYTTLKVKEESGSQESVTGIELEQKSLELYVGREAKLSGKVKPANATNRKLIWKSNKNNIATVDVTGTVRGVSEGQAVITVETEDGGFTDSCTIKVSKLDVDAMTSASLKDYKKAMHVGEKTKLEINYYPENAPNKNVSWKSNNESVATIKDGYVIGVNPGEATITMTTEDGGFVDVCKIIVKKQFKRIKLRIEGTDKTLYEKDLPVTGEKTALDLLETGVGEKAIKIEGGMIKSILGVEPNWDKDKAYWGIYIAKNGETKAASEGVTILKIHDLDEVLFHVIKGTTLPVLEYKNDGNNKKIIVKTTIKDNIKNVEGATLEINDKTYTTDSNGEAYIDVPLGKYIGKIYKKDKDGKFVELIRCTQNFNVGSIKILETSDLFPVGDTIKLEAKVFDGAEELKGKSIKWYTSNKEVATVDENTGVVKTIKEGVVTITAQVEGVSHLNESLQLTIQKNVSNKQVIENTVNNLRKYYKNHKEFDITETLSYRHTSNELVEDLKTIQEKHKIVAVPKTASEYANAILGLIALGENPRDYKGKDFVDGLVQLQTKDGKFILGKYDDYPTVSAISIIALDRAKADYRVEDAVKALMNYQNDDGTFGPYKDIDTLAMSMKGLYKHKDIVGVNKCIDKAVEKLSNEKQNIMNKNVNTLATVIQGLVSVGENPLVSKWSVGGKTMLNSLFKYKSGDTFGNDLATEQVFAALADLHKKESMYTGAKISSEGYDKLFIPLKEGDIDNNGIEEGDKVTIFIEGYKGIIISEQEVEIKKGESLWDVTKRILDENGKSYNVKPDGFVDSIDGQSTFDKGINSGWMIHVNGKNIQTGVDSYKLKGGENIHWFYTSDYKTDSRNTDRSKYATEDKVQNQIDAVKNILNNKNASEKDLTKAIKDVSSKLNEKAQKINSEKDAKDFVKCVKNISQVIKKAIDKIKTEEGAKDLAIENINVVKTLEKAVEKLKKDSDKKQVSETIVENMEITLKVMDKIKGKEVGEIAGDVIESARSLIKKLGKENCKEIKEKAVQTARKAVEKASKQKIEKDQLKVDEKKVIAKIDRNKVKDLGKIAVNTIKDMKEKLKNNNIESDEEFERKLTIEVVDAGKEEIETNLPSNMMETLRENRIKKLSIKTEVAEFNVTLKTFGDKGNDKEISLSAKKIDRNDLSALARYKIPEGSPIVDLNARVGQEKVSKFEDPIEIRIPYEEKVKEEKEVKVFFLNDNGMIEKVGGEYDPVTKTIIFKTIHFSKYFVKQVDKLTKKVFTDLKDYPWAKEAIETMASEGVINGRTDKKFDPAANITRAEFATLVTKMMAYSTENMKVPFEDVAKEAWYYNYVVAAHNKGLISGRSNNIFDPNGNITREEMTVIVAKVLEKKEYTKESLNNLNVFKDTESISLWAKDSVSLCVKENIISGMGESIFAPKENANRAQAAVILYKVYELIK
ncbi:MAG: S-layer homology domain-containing protein [Anaeromicrobium sp.]|uniref:S-layer homology domain-containing protein n=1 Tax=Anaeromicrobium sp. TaxID=1929132 RepID=UPI0025FBCF98|nr:S-layer homology domain-containing protein [Anaeromicrobium sp.]MCT4594919.1 S-layer homology domain-containing protein [Anaeromicrobium sp.]